MRWIAMLVSMKELLDHANREYYAIAAPNICSELDTRAFIEAAEELQAPLILDIASDANPDMYFLAQVARALAKESSVPIAINLDHGGAYEDIVDAVRSNFTGVMVDRSSLPYEENVRDVKEIVKMAHAVGISVEAELGHVGDAGQYDIDRNAALTDPQQALNYIQATGVDCLAVAIGTAHGEYPMDFIPYLDFDRLKSIKRVTNEFPLVLHGSSGTKIEDLKKVCKMGINKVNICFDLNAAAWNALDAARAKGASAYDLFPVIHDELKKKMKELILIYGSDGKAWNIPNKGLLTKAITMKES